MHTLQTVIHLFMSIISYSYFTPTTAVLGNCVGSGGVYHWMFHLFPGTVDHIAHKRVIIYALFSLTLVGVEECKNHEELSQTGSAGLHWWGFGQIQALCWGSTSYLLFYYILCIVITRTVRQRGKIRILRLKLTLSRLSIRYGSPAP